MLFDDSKDDEPKNVPEEKEDKKPFDINDKDMNQMIMIVAIVGILFLFKDEIMNLFKGGLPGSTPAPTTTTETETPAEGGEAETETGETGKKGGRGRGRGRGRHGRRGGRRGGGKAGRKAMRDKAEAELRSKYANYGMSYFGIANA